ncbi:viral A-type inclusion protein [Rickettsia rhipicephali]|uniref:viral A-type inclusion protein n=1 Tax=Rickettsia rhipicephali TaxID=33992 RepID=UPI0022574E38|nr:viral A-type inclusion protein [Rickettsia rhipicephali]MCX4079878.1 viral A-type inclusion protein [Rickettsia rhipicephali]
MKKESNNQNQDLEEKQNILEISENTSNATNSAESSQLATPLNVEPSIDDDAVNKLKNQLSFSTKALEKQQQELSKVLSSSAEQLNDAVKTFDKTITAQKNQYEILQNEVGVLTVLPEKTKEAVTNIIPDVAKELDKIQKEYIKSLHDSYSTIISGYAEEIQKYKTEIDQVSHGLTSHITKHISSVDQKLDEYSKKLSASAAYVVECSNYSFLKNMCLVVLFSAIVAGGTAYLVTTKFPRYLTVTGANNVTIQDCDVSVLGKAKDPDNLMDKMTKKK